MQLHYQKISENQRNCRRNVILSLILSVYTDRPLLSVIITDIIDSAGNGIYRILKSWNSVMTWNFFSRVYRRNDRGIQTRFSIQWRDPFAVGITDGTCPSVIPLIKANIYTLCRLSPPLFLLFLPHPNSPLPNCNHLSQLSPSSQHKHSSFLYFCTWSQHPFSD